jgi:hypothetical protein
LKVANEGPGPDIRNPTSGGRQSPSGQPQFEVVAHNSIKIGL